MNTRPDCKAQKRTGRSLGLLPFALSLMVAACLPPVFAVNANDANLLKLEQKFFYTTYAKETMDQRLDRLEKMIFGEAKDGSEDARLSQLISAVPSLNKPADSDDGETAQAPPRSTGNRQAPPAPRADYDDEPRAQKPQPGNYPAVTAIERRVLGKDFQSEPVDQRLARLETKVFGKPSGVSDLTDRMDRLKASTGVDITRQAPPNSEWADEDDDDTFTEPPAPVAKSGEDGKSFSGRDLRQDMRKAFGMTNSSPRPTYGGQSGMYGSGGLGSSSSSAGSGAYGMGGTPRAYAPQRSAPSYAPQRPSANSFNMDDEDDDLPITGGGGIPVAPDRRLAARPPVVPQAPAGIGLNQQISMMEEEVFGKTYKDPIPQRVERLEKNLFPNERPQSERALPDRVARLNGVIQISPNGARSPQVAQGNQSQNDRFEDDDLGMPNMPKQGQQRGSGGLGKIINSISNLLGGGFTGGYPMQSGNVITDPRTGLLFDTVTGNLIDPATGMVVGQRAVRGYGTGYPGMGMGGMGGFSNFNNGFAPYGMGGSGIRFGGSGMGFGYGGRMWP